MINDGDLTTLHQRFEQGDRADAEAVAVGIAQAALAAEEYDRVIAVTRVLAALPPPWGAGVEALRHAIKDRLNGLVGMPGGDIAQRLALCDAVIELAPTFDAPFVELAITCAIYLIGDRQRSQAYTDRLFAFGRRLEERALSGGPPECGIEDGAARAQHILAGHGVVLVRNLASPARCDAAREQFEQAVAGTGKATVTLETLDLGFSIFRGKAETFLQEVMASVLGTPVLQPHMSVIRRVHSGVPATATPFHQDVKAFGYNLVNVWTPLVACGETLPGLEFVARRTFDSMATDATDDEYNHVKIDRDRVVGRFGEEALFAPEMALGDALMFLGTTIHRTHLTPAMAGTRSSIEMRYINPW